MTRNAIVDRLARPLERKDSYMANRTKIIALLLGALGIVACGRERPAEPIGTTMTTRGTPSQHEQPAATAEEVRTVLIEKHPGDAEQINALVITSEDGIVTLRGRVDDEAKHSDLVNRVRSIPNVRGVRDEIRVGPKGGTAPGERAPSGQQPTQPQDQQQLPE